MGTSLTFHGAAGTVTGSKYLLQHGQRRVLVDCGLYQGEREWRGSTGRPLPFDPPLRRRPDPAHLDHCGYVRPGAAGLLRADLGDARHRGGWRDRPARQRAPAGGGRRERPARRLLAARPPLPLYTEADAELCIKSLRTVPFGEARDLGDGVRFTLRRAGHILGSSTVLAELGDARVLFSGDLGRPSHGPAPA